MFELSVTNILLIASIVLQLIVLILVLRQNKRLKRLEEGNSVSPSVQIAATTDKKNSGPMESGIVFCRNCGNPYDSGEKACPSCKEQR